MGQPRLHEFAVRPDQLRGLYDWVVNPQLVSLAHKRLGQRDVRALSEVVARNLEAES